MTKVVAEGSSSGGGVMSEISAGGAKGFFGIDQLDWGNNGGPCYAFWQTSKCWGDGACSPKDAVFCCLQSYCCPLAFTSKMYASSLDAKCAIVDHVLMAWCCPWVTCIAMRYNQRKKHGIPGNICGDIMCLWCCTYCACLQQMRSFAPQDWNYVCPCEITAKSPECQILRK